MGRSINAKGGVWKYFDLNVTKTANCKTCHVDVDRPRGCTNLTKEHLRKFHRSQYSDLEKGKDKFKERGKLCANVMVDNPALGAEFFQSESFLAFFPPGERGTFPTRAQLVGTIIPNEIANLKAENKSRVAGQAVSVVTDSWTNKGGKVALTAIIGYFVNKNWEREGVVFRIVPTECRHTAENLASLIETALAEFNVQPTAIVSDSASNIRKAVRLLNVQNIVCASHQLHLNVRYGMTRWTGVSLVKRLKKFAYTLNISMPVRKLYYTNCETLKLAKRAVPQSVETRWSSDYIMIKTALEQISAVNMTLRANGDAEFCATEQCILNEVRVLLEPYALYTETLCKEDAPLGDALMVWDALRSHFKEYIAREKGDVVQLAQYMLDDVIAKRWGVCFDDDNLLCTAFFDPTVVGYFNSTDIDRVNIDWKSVAGKLEKSISPMAGSVSSTPSPTPSPYISRRAALFPGLAKLATQAQTVSSPLAKELSDYLAAVGCGEGNGEEAMIWWKHRQDQFPILSNEARRRLGTPPTSVAAERLFSHAGLLYRSHLKSRLTAEHGEDRLLLRMSRIKSYRSVWNQCLGHEGTICRALSAIPEPIFVPMDEVPKDGDGHQDESDESGEESELES